MPNRGQLQNPAALPAEERTLGTCCTGGSTVDSSDEKKTQLNLRGHPRTTETFHPMRLFKNCSVCLISTYDCVYQLQFAAQAYHPWHKDPDGVKQVTRNRRPSMSDSR